jgi:hypothetical protein
MPHKAAKSAYERTVSGVEGMFISGIGSIGSDQTKRRLAVICGLFNYWRRSSTLGRQPL